MSSNGANAAHELRERIRQHLHAERSGWVELAGLMHTVHGHSVYRELGADSFQDWMAQEDIGRSRGYLLVSVWQTMVVDGGVHWTDLQGTELSKYIWVLRPVRRGEASPLDALLDVRALSRSDLREKYGVVSIPDEDEEAMRCPTCGQLLPSP